MTEPSSESGVSPAAAPTVDSPYADRDELEVGRQVDRYTVVAEAGAGGMGRVFRAYDPELRREVAIKLLRRVGTPEAIARMLREAKAMAQLSHPNVLPVFDVQRHGESIFIAMEYVEGQTLRRWLREQSRSWQEVLTVFRAAGRGLAAAHEVGLVHRDFKPSNVLIADRELSGTDRVRVMDFGLARAVGDTSSESSAGGSEVSRLSEDLTQAGMVLGTPAYMAPEQHTGKGVSPQSDQYSFCVALWEALYGKRPFEAHDESDLVKRKLEAMLTQPAQSVPRWLHAAVVRGLSADPAARWPSMPALLEVLDRDLGARRRWLVTGLAIVSIGAAVAWYGSERTAPVSACTGGDDKFAGTWDSQARAEIGGAFSRTGLSYAGESWHRVEAVVDDFVDQWVESYESTCRGGEQLDRRMSCLEHARGELGALVELFTVADEPIVRNAVAAAHGLPAVARCSDPAALSRRLAPPTDPAVRSRVDEQRESLARVRALRRSGRYAEARELAETVVSEADELGYGPVRAEARADLAKVQDELGAYAEYAATLEAAYAMALEADHEELAASVATGMVLALGFRLGELDAAQRWAREAESWIRRLGQPDRLSASLLANHGAVLLARGHHAEARHFYERSVTILHDLFGPDHLSVATQLSNVGITFHSEGDFANARAYFVRCLVIHEKALGPSHPDVGRYLNNVGASYGDGGHPEDARWYFERALSVYERTLSPDHPSVSGSRSNLANMMRELGHEDEAERAHRRALSDREHVLGSRHLKVAESLNNLGEVMRDQRRFVEAERFLQRALATRERILGLEHPRVGATRATLGAIRAEEAPTAQAEHDLRSGIAILERAVGPHHLDIGGLLATLGELLVERGQLGEAIACLDRSIVVLDRYENAGATSVRMQLADALWEADQDRPRARGLASEALGAMRAAGEDESVAAIEDWLARHRLR